MKHFFTTLFILGVLGVFAQDPAAIKTYLEEGMDKFQQEGMTYGVVAGDELVLKDALGFADAPSNKKMNTETVFELASLSKAFTAASIGILVDNGMLNWQDKVVDHFPDYSMYDAYVEANMEIQDLLCHRNGYNTFDGDLLWYGTDYTLDEILGRFSKLNPKHGFRNEYGYSNLNFIAAAKIIELKSGQSWHDFIQDSILSPLNMGATKTRFDEFTALENKAHPHIKGVSIPFQNFDNARGAVGVRSNITDLAKWAKMWLNKGMLPDSSQLLTAATAHKIFTLHTPRPVSEANIASGKLFNGAALGWFTTQYNGTRLMTHSGGLPGYILNLAVMPEADVAVIVLTNGTSILPFAATNYLLDQYTTPSTETDWVEKYLAYVGEEQEEKAALKPTRLNKSSSYASLLGVYEDPMYGKAEVFEVGGLLKFKMIPTEKYFESAMEMVEEGVFRIKFQDPFLPEGKVNFEYNSAGFPTGLTVELPNPDFHFYNLKFKKLK